MSTTIKSLYGETLTIEIADDLEVIIKSSSLRGCLYKTADLLDAVAAETNRAFVPTTPEAVDARNARELALYGIDRFDTHTCKAVPKDAAVILRNTLPEVTGEEPGYSGYVKIGERQFGLSTVEFYDSSIRNLLALREYVTAHPPVDEAQVTALTGLLIDADMDHPDGPVPALVARRLYLAGVRIEATS